MRKVKNMVKKLSFPLIALVAGMSLANTTSVPKPANLVDLTDDSASRVTTTSTGVWLKGPGTAFHNKGTANKDANYRVIKNSTTLNFIYTFDEATKVNAYAFCTFDNGMPKRAPLKWNIYGSNTYDPAVNAEPDGTWTLIDSRDDETDWGNSEYRYFTCGNNTAYGSYKVDILSPQSGHDNYLQFNFMELFYDSTILTPHFGDCSLTSVSDGEYTLSGSISENDATNVSLVLTPNDGGAAKTIVLGAPAQDGTFGATIDASSEGLSETVMYSAKLIAENDSGTSEKELGKCFFGPAPRPTSYAKKIEFAVSEPIAETLGEDSLADFPVLVRLSSETIQNFDPTEFRVSGRDLFFTDEDGDALSFELDTFNASGETLVWVKIPSLSADSKFFCYYGGPENFMNDPTDVWTGYLGVWHFNASGDAAPNATANGGLDASAASAASALSGADTPFGSTAVAAGAGFSVADYEPAYSVGNRFSVSGWFKLPTFEGTSGKYATWVSKKVGLSWNAGTGWYLQMNQSKTKCGLVESSGTETMYSSLPDATTNWNYFNYVNDGKSEKVYFNGSTTPGISRSSGTINASSTVFQMLAANQQGDEFRISKSAWTALRTSLECQTMSYVAFLSNTGATVMDATAPVIAVPTVSRTADGYLISADISENEPVSGSVKCVIGETEYEMDGTGTGTYSVTVTDLSTGTYSCLVQAESANGNTIQRKCPTVFYVGDISIEFGQDAREEGFVAGWFTISRGDANMDLEINFEVDSASTAVAGQTYETLVSPVVIPDGETSVRIVVTPKIDPSTQSDATVKVNLADGMYGIDGTKASAQLTVVNLVSRDGWNTWVAVADGKASDDGNWSLGHAPTATEKVLFDGRFSNAKCEWDTDATHVVSAWKQENGYTSAVEFDTEFPDFADATFPLFTISGDCEILSGKWTHRGNYNNYGAATESNTAKLSEKRWCLNVQVGGDLTVAGGASIDATGKGFGHPGNQSSPCYGGYVFDNNNSCAPYGSITEPFDPGMGCRSQGDQNKQRSSTGGGAVKIVAEGTVAIDGSVLAVGTVDLNVPRSGGTGGSIWIVADRISGSGTIDASGCPPGYMTSDQGVALGSGGRIALYTASALEFARENVFCSGSGYSTTSGGSKTKIGSCGTIFIKDQSMANGVLFLRQPVALATSLSAKAAVPLMDETTTLDGIELSGRVALAVESGKTLNLPNGFASVVSDATGIGVNGISGQGGTINAGSGDQTISGWMFEPVSNFTFTANVTLSDAGGIGIIRRNICGTGDAAIPPRSVAFTVNGDLSVDTTSAVDVGNVVGYSNYGSGTQGGWYGGWTTYYNKNGNQTGARELTYGSVFNPQDFGSSPGRAFLAGGAVDMTVRGTLELDGKVNASAPVSDSTYDGSAPSSGGSIKITAGSITGGGAIKATGGAGRYSYAGGGAGGRIAIKLTGPNETVPETIDVNAQGSYGYAFNAAATKLGSAGTIYVETAANVEKGGTVTISNWRDRAIAAFTSATVIPTTPIAAYANGDPAESFKKTSLVVTNNAIAEVSAEYIKINGLEVSAGSGIELMGGTLAVNTAKLGDAKLQPGTYFAGDAALGDFVTDSAGGGTLMVRGTGLSLIVR